VLSRRIHGVDGRRLVETLGRALVPGLAVALVTWGISRALGWSGPGPALVTTIVGLAVGALVYVAGAAAMRLPELTVLRSLIPVGNRGDRT
jgi:hypothetical protein